MKMPPPQTEEDERQAVRDELGFLVGVVMSCQMTLPAVIRELLRRDETVDLNRLETAALANICQAIRDEFPDAWDSLP